MNGFGLVNENEKFNINLPTHIYNEIDVKDFLINKNHYYFVNPLDLLYFSVPTEMNPVFLRNQGFNSNKNIIRSDHVIDIIKELSYKEYVDEVIYYYFNNNNVDKKIKFIHSHGNFYSQDIADNYSQNICFMDNVHIVIDSSNSILVSNGKYQKISITGENSRAIICGKGSIISVLGNRNNIVIIGDELDIDISGNLNKIRIRGTNNKISVHGKYNTFIFNGYKNKVISFTDKIRVSGFDVISVSYWKNSINQFINRDITLNTFDCLSLENDILI